MKDRKLGRRMRENKEEKVNVTYLVGHPFSSKYSKHELLVVATAIAQT
jgi:hypothetical protein